MTHVPVLVREVVSYLKLRSPGVYLDATVGCGGHAKSVLEAHPESCIICMDVDSDALGMASINLSDYKKRVKFFNKSYTAVREVLSESGIDKVSGVIADFGVSSIQLDEAARGFSFKSEAPLDMRMDKRTFLTARDVVNTLSEEELADIFYIYAQEKFSRRIARRIVDIRKKKMINSTKELSDIVVSCYPQRMRHNLHPATKVFQSLRICVNRELENIEKFIEVVPSILEKNARVVVISYHSGEDRLVKQKFREGRSDGYYSIITKKPIEPSDDEKNNNPRSRSAKLRCAEKIV